MNKARRNRVSFLLLLTSLCSAGAGWSQDWNFESGSLSGWTKTGSAFDHQPTFGNNIQARLPGVLLNQQGSFWIGTFENHPNRDVALGTVQGDAPQGTLATDLFTLMDPVIAFLVGGGRMFEERVELLVLATPTNRSRFENATEPDGTPFSYERIHLGDGNEYYRLDFATGLNSETMRRVVWNASAGVGERVRIRVADESSGPWGHINCDDFQFASAAVPSSTRIHVSDEDGADVRGAEVFTRWFSRGVTDANGFLDITPALGVGTPLIARVLIRENPSPYGHRSTGSSQDWNYRVYLTSLRIDTESTPANVVSAAAVQELRIESRNVLIGLHLLAALEWDASQAELEGFRDNIVGPASNFLYNATDGQFLIEQMELTDQQNLWNDTDFRVWTDSSLRAYAYLNNFHWPTVFGNGHLNMSRQSPERPRLSPEKTYVHEFGHYGFDLADEYADNGPDICTGALRGSIWPFVPGAPKAACIMYNEYAVGKLCSRHHDNPHAFGTGQGEESCWLHISTKFHDNAPRPPETFFGDRFRWHLVLPEDRRELLGTLPALQGDWIPRVNIDNRAIANLCQPKMFRFVQMDGRPIEDQDVWLHTTDGRYLKEGKTTQQNVSAMEPGGQITVAGMHIGDRINVPGLEDHVVNASECTLALSTNGGAVQPGTLSALGLWQPRLLHIAAMAKFIRWPVFQLATAASESEIKMRSSPFNLAVWVESAAKSDQAIVRVRASRPLRSLSSVVFSDGEGGKPRGIAMSFDAEQRLYTGVLTPLTPKPVRGLLRVIAEGDTGASVTATVGVSISPFDPKAPGEVFSNAGDFSVTVPPKGLPAGSHLAIGPPPPLAILGGDRSLLAGPIHVISSTGGNLEASGIFRFRLAQASGKQALSPDPRVLEVWHYNVAGLAELVPSHRIAPPVNIVTFTTDRLGTYALTARTADAPAFAFKSVTLRATPDRFEGVCPATISVKGEITAVGRGSVTYTFTRSDGAQGPALRLDFEDGGTKPVTTAWTLGGAALPSYDGWIAVKILSPESASSNQARFSVQCVP